MGVACLEFRGENFRGWLKNREIHEKFLPRKFPAKHSNVLNPSECGKCLQILDCLGSPQPESVSASVMVVSTHAQ